MGSEAPDCTICPAKPQRVSLCAIDLCGKVSPMTSMALSSAAGKEGCRLMPTAPTPRGQDSVAVISSFPESKPATLELGLMNDAVPSSWSTQRKFEYCGYRVYSQDSTPYSVRYTQTRRKFKTEFDVSPPILEKNVKAKKIHRRSKGTKFSQAADGQPTNPLPSTKTPARLFLTHVRHVPIMPTGLSHPHTTMRNGRDKKSPMLRIWGGTSAGAFDPGASFSSWFVLCW